MDPTGSVIVTGIPGSGKSTIARAIAERAPSAAHLEADAIYNLVIGGRIHFRPDSPDADWWQLDLAREHTCVLACSFAAHDVLPVVDDVIAEQGTLDEYHARLPKPVRLIVLTPTIDVVLARDANRHKQVAERWTYLADRMSNSLAGVGLWIDTSTLTVDETMTVIEARLDETLVDDLPAQR